MPTASPALSRREGAIVLVPSDATWPAAFAREASLISGSLSDLPMDVHHIGSTAIANIVAKPVIDMLGIVPAVEALDARAYRLAAFGYEGLGEFGIPGRRYFRKNAVDGTRTHQLHAFAADSPEIQRHLDFRDYLRAFPVEADAYGALKQSLAGSCGSDMPAYSDGKTEFIRAIDRRAATWRARVMKRIAMPSEVGDHVTVNDASDPHGLRRFVDTQARDYDQALAEIKSGQKRSHWMWYVFPQYHGLGSSQNARTFAIESVAEAKAYLQHDILGPRLVRCAETLLGIEGRSAREIMGSPDDVKLRSCATLFSRVSSAGSPFHRLLDRFFAGEPDRRTLELIEHDAAVNDLRGDANGPP